ncbi:MAG: outer membrane lipoprotein-sorting protein [Verrucomicrobiota bacterium]
MRSSKAKTNRLAVALALVGVNYIAQAGGMPRPAPVVRDEVAGQALAQQIRSSMPAENMERTGVLVIKSGKTKTQIPVRCQVKLHEGTWETDYQTTDTPAAGAERLVIIHSTNGPSRYLYARASRPGAALPEPSPLSPEQLDAPFAGSDFSLSDLGLEFLHWPGQCQLTPGEMRKGQSCYRLESTNPRKSGIVRVNASIDKESLGPLYAEAYDSEGKRPIKVFSLDSMKKDAQGRYDVKEMEIDNKKSNSLTDLIFDIPKGP